MKYGFIGCGNMGGAVASALSKVTTDFVITDRSGKGRALAERLGCTYADPAFVAQNSDRLFLCVKPQMMADALGGIAHILREKKSVIITMAAGMKSEKICEIIGENLPVIRIMPNTPVLVGKGIVLYCANELTDEDTVNELIDDLKYAGRFDHLPERLFDGGTALAGSGPAYAYMFMDALADGAVACGIPREKSLEYAVDVLIGAAEMVSFTGKHPDQLKKEVCSPGGSTIEGVKVLEQAEFRNTVVECILAAYKRNGELGK